MAKVIKTVTLAPGEAKPAEFQFRPMEARVYQVSVDGLSGSFSVIEAPPPPVTGLSTIGGRVRDARTGEGMSFVSVSLNGYGVLTSRLGFYLLQNVMSGTYTITFSQKTYQTETRTITLLAGTTTTLDVSLKPLIEIIQMPLNVSVSFEPHYYYHGEFLLWQGGTLTVHASNPDSRFRDWEYDEESPGGAVGCLKGSRVHSPLIGYFHPAELARGGSESWDINLKGGSYPVGTRLIVNVSFQTRFTRGTEVIRLNGLGRSPSITLTT